MGSADSPELSSEEEPALRRRRRPSCWSAPGLCASVAALKHARFAPRAAAEPNAMTGSADGRNNNNPGYQNNTRLGPGKSGDTNPDRHTFRWTHGSTCCHAALTALLAVERHCAWDQARSATPQATCAHNPAALLSSSVRAAQQVRSWNLFSLACEPSRQLHGPMPPLRRPPTGPPSCQAKMKCEKCHDYNKVCASPLHMPSNPSFAPHQAHAAGPHIS